MLVAQTGDLTGKPLSSMEDGREDRLLFLEGRQV
jgi:hypothetical protein